MGGNAMDEFMQAAIEEARLGLAECGIPIGSVLAFDGKIVGWGHNCQVQKGSAILHARWIVLNMQAGSHPIHSFRLNPGNCVKGFVKVLSAEDRFYNVGMRRVSSVQSLPIDFLMRSFTPLKAGAGIIICQVRVMFSRSLCPIKGNNHATISGNRSWGTMLAIIPNAFLCSGKEIRSLKIR